MRKKWLSAGLLLAAVGVVFATTATGSGKKSTSGGTFKLGTASGIDSLNPYVAFNQDAYSAFEYIYPVLIQYDINLRYAPFFANSRHASNGGNTLDFKAPPNRKVARRKASDGCRRCLDDQHRHQIQGRS